MTDFLYPFIDGHERDAASLLAELATSAEAKAHESGAVRAATLQAEGIRSRAAEAMAARFAAGGRLFAFGNGGSATDAAAVVALFVRPPHGLPLASRSLAAEEAVVTALANDVGFDLVFSRQLIAHARSEDIALGLSTSGSSNNVLDALSEARRRGLLTVGLAGFDGGRMAVSPDVDYCLVVRASSIHRVQETQAAIAVALWSGVQERMPRLVTRPA